MKAGNNASRSGANPCTTGGEVCKTTAAPSAWTRRQNSCRLEANSWTSMERDLAQSFMPIIRKTTSGRDSSTLHLKSSINSRVVSPLTATFNTMSRRRPNSPRTRSAKCCV